MPNQNDERCGRCGMKRASSIHMTDSTNTEICLAAHPFEEPPPEYACMRGHVVTAATDGGEPINLIGFFCPVCIGRTTGFAMLEPCVLSAREAL